MAYEFMQLCVYSFFKNFKNRDREITISWRDIDMYFYLVLLDYQHY